MNYCSRCIIPITRPDQSFNKKNVCNACISFKNRKNINWEKRWSIFLDKIEKIKNLKRTGWNCVIPSSGGKDSTYQAIKAKELGLNPILVTATTCDLSDLGRENLENLKKMGFDTIEICPNLKTRAKLNKICQKEIGDISWPEHVSIFTVPINFAIKSKIPLVLWGENPQMEYGGPKAELTNTTLNRKWMEEFGGLLGLRVSDFVDNYGFTENEMHIYKYLSIDELEDCKIESLFMGFYEPWDSSRNLEVAKKNGFKTYKTTVENCFLDSEKLDNHQHGIHDYFKYLKYGFGRASDQLSVMIRKKMITRDEAIIEVQKFEGMFPNSYLGKDINDILEKIDLTKNEFIKICEKYTNKNIFKCNQAGELLKDGNGNLIKKLDYN